MKFTPPSTRLLVALALVVAVAVGAMGVVSADANATDDDSFAEWMGDQFDDETIEWMQSHHDDHHPGEHHDDHHPGEHHDDHHPEDHCH